MRRITALVLLCSICSLTVPAAAAPPDETDRIQCAWHLKAYLDALVAGDLDSARTFWRPQDLEGAARLGIGYDDPSLKVDGASPVWALLPALRDSTAAYVGMPPTVVSGGPLDGVVRQLLALDHHGRRTRFFYHFAPDGDRWLLASPVRLVCEQGPGVPGRFVTVYERLPAAPWTLPPYLTAQLDSCVTAMAERLDLAPDARRRLADARLGYLLAAPETVETLAGAPTVGVANLQQDVVVTSHPCHVHELAHLLVNHWLGDLPLYTLPLLQEGAAVHLAGRWGRHPRVLDRLGRTSLADGFVSLDDLLTRDGFHAQMADLTYPPAGVFVGFILDRHGADGLRRAYLAGSGSLAEVAGWDAAAVQERLAGALGVSWDALAADIAAYAADGPAPAVAPGMMPGPWSAMTYRREAGLDLRWTDDLERRHVVFTVSAADGPARGALLFGGGDDTAPANDLFAEHFPGREYRGETHALVFSPDEAKLYDYRSQMLVALHAQGFWPADGFATADGRGLRFGVRKDLLPPGPGSLAVFGD